MPPAPPLAAGVLTVLLTVLLGVAGFLLVTAVAVAVMALIQLVLPGGDTGAEAVARTEEEREEEGGGGPVATSPPEAGGAPAEGGRTA